ncbi:MAG TPA: hypothetical protein VJ792_08505 [Candidatus Nitrosotalea sp.]|nr:hypothetical protein [Candidatus Nitrosotalea sp.]
MNVKLLAAVMITGLVLSGSSAYLQKVFADDQWSQVAQRELMAQERAAITYAAKYTNNDVNESTRTWAGLGYTTTDETSKGRDLNSAAQVSAQNALGEFDKIHAKQLVAFQDTGYAGLNSTTTDEQGRDRNALVSQAEAQSLNSSESIVSELARINATYTNLQDQGTTNEQAPDRQAQIQKTWDDMETQATALVNAITKIDTDYVNLKAGPTTNENTVGRQLDAAQANALGKAITIFQEIHAKNLAYTYGTGYTGLSSSTTNENVYIDRNSAIETASEMALQNAVNTYDSYYNGAGLNQTLYSH